MASELAVTPIVLAAEMATCGGSNLRWTKEGLAVLPGTAKPSLTVTITNLKSPCEILDLYELTR
jgi:hypothetical protein